VWHYTHNGQTKDMKHSQIQRHKPSSRSLMLNTHIPPTDQLTLPQNTQNIWTHPLRHPN